MTSSGKISGGQLIGKALQLEGVKNVFGIAGDHVLPVMNDMDDMGFRFVDTRHEQAAVHMADAWGRITGQPGVVMYTTPGFANAIPGLTAAMHSGSPLISISGCAELSELGRGAMQEIDQVGMAKPITKGSWMVTDARRIPDMIAHAVRVAYSGRRGPVHLTIPVDIQQEFVSEDEVNFYTPSEYRGIGAARASQDQIEQVIQILNAAERPLLIAGSAAAYTSNGEFLAKFIEATKLPLMTEGDARGLVSDDHPYCFGFFDRALNRAAQMIGDADVVVLMGRKQDLIMGYAMPPVINANAKIIQIDPSEAEIGRNRGVAVGIAGDVGAVVEQLTEEAAKHSWTDLPWLKVLAEARIEWEKHLETLAEPQVPIHAMTVHKAVRQNLSEDDYLVFMVATTATGAAPTYRPGFPRAGGTFRHWECWATPFRRPWRASWPILNGECWPSRETALLVSTAWSSTQRCAITWPLSQSWATTPRGVSIARFRSVSMESL